MPETNTFVCLTGISGGDSTNNVNLFCPSTVEFTLSDSERDAIASAVKSELDIDIKTILGLSQNNYRFLNQCYDSSGRLTAGVIKLYNNAEDVITDTSPFQTYQITSSYDSNGNLIDYRVVRN